MRYFFCFFILSFFIIQYPIYGQQLVRPKNTNTSIYPLITDIPNRNKISLNGEWHYIVDPYNTGFIDYRHHVKSNSFFKNRKVTSPYDLVEYNFQSSPTLRVPGDWNTQNDTLLYYEGTVWYEKTFNYHKKSGKRVFLYFGAVNYDAVVGLNGHILGRHTGGFTPFNFEVTDKLKEGENFIVVKVNNQRHLDGVPTDNFDWWNYGGITRAVYLIETPGTFVRDYFIHLSDRKEREISGWIQVDGNNNEFCNIYLGIPELKRRISIETNGEGYASFSFSEDDIQLWSPENPKLYKLIFTIDKNALEDKVGFRTIAAKGDQILLNGKPIFLRGTSLHEEAPGLEGGRVYKDSQVDTLLHWVKELNCNFVRLAHYPHNETMIRKAEQQGVLVWSEIPVYWTIQWNNDSTLHNAKNQLIEEITRDRNRANIILWSVGNETPLTDGRLAFMRTLVRTARSLDSTRLIAAALQITSNKNGVAFLNDPLGQYLDVLGCNTYPGWYYKPTPHKKFETKYNKPLIMTEFGAGALQGLHGSSMERWTEEFQERVFKKDLIMLKKIPFLRGVTPWILKDFRSPKRLSPYFQNGWNRKGLISNLGKKKEAFYILKAFYEKIIDGQIILAE